MAKKRAESRLFESDYTISGKHATYIKFLVNEAKLFNDYIDVYMNAAVLGFIYSKKVEKDSESTDRARIYSDAFSTHRADCIFLYRLIMLLEGEEIDVEERLDKAFRYDSNPNKAEELNQNIEVFNSYVRGGIEYMYQTFTSGCTSRDDYIRQSFSTIRDFKDELNNTSYEEKINKLLGK